MSRGRWLLTFYGIALVCGVAFFAAGELQPAIVLTLFSAPAAVWGAIKDDLPKPRRPSEQRIATLRSDFTLSPWLVLLVVTAALQLFERIAAALVGAAVAVGLAGVGIDDAAFLETVVLGSVALPSVITSFLAVGPVAVWAAHRLARWPHAWVFAGVLLSNLLSILVAAFLYGWPSPSEALNSLALIGVLSLLWLPGIVAGVWWARRTRPSFVISRLFGELSPADQADLVEIARIAGIARVAVAPPAPAAQPTPTVPAASMAVE